jgi:thioredoxin reductase (NADPH)
VDYDSIIIGGGPAGLSAALYLARYNRSCLVIDHSRGRWGSHELNENYLGFPHGVRSKRLRELGRKQAARFGAKFCRAKATKAQLTEGGFLVTAGRHSLHGRTLILATGVRDKLPDIGDTEEYWGRSLFWCITCDGHKTIGSRVAVVGKTDEAAITALQFRNFTNDIVLVTNCTPDKYEMTEDGRARLDRAGIASYESPISHVEGSGGMMHSVVLADGTRLAADFMFSEQGMEPRNELAGTLGVTLSKHGFIETDADQRTNLPLVYAAGDVTRAYAHQLVTAAHEGATAGISANYDLYAPDQKH